MIITPRELLDTSIAQLQVLAAFVGDQLGERSEESGFSTPPEVRACQEILVSLGALILRLQTVRGLTSAGVRSERREAPPAEAPFARRVTGTAGS